MLIDFYGFVGPWPYWDVPHTSPPAVLRLMDRHQIDALAVCSTRSIFSDWRQGNEETLALAREHPDRFFPFISVSPILPGAELAGYLWDCKSHGARGIRLYPQHQSYSLGLGSGPATILETAQELGLPVVLPIRAVMDWGLKELDPATVEATVSRYPNLRFVLSGLNYDMTLWAYDFMRRAPNVQLEISGMQGFRAVDEAVQAVGPERLLFGSGLPVLYPACSTEKLRVAKIGQAARRAIAETNARRLLGVSSG